MGPGAVTLPMGYRIWALLYPALPLLLIILVAWRWPHLWNRHFRRIESSLRRLAANRLASATVVFLLPLLLSLLIAALVGWPAPVIGDEFSYLLAGETFAHGRAANAPHPFWRHFESLHILQQPGYASKYPPAQGLLLAFGSLLFGEAIVGVWICLALGCVTIWWMLGAWLGKREALAGGLVAGLHPMLLEWGQNYWGGSAALLGGALTIGAWGRIKGRWRAGDGLLFGLGLAILANSRPFEGSLLGLLLLATTLRSLWRRESAVWPLLRHFLAPAMVVLLPAVLLMGWYNHRVTGSPWRLPYAVHEANYAVAPPFLWQQAAAEPGYNHESIRRFYTGFALDTYREQRTPAGFLKKGVIRKTGVLLRGYLATTVMAIALLLLPVVWRRDRGLRPVLIILGGFLVVVFGITWMMPHYAAPVAGLIFLLTIRGWRYLRTWRPRGQRTGLWLARAAMVCSLLAVVHLGLRLDRDRQTTWAWAAGRAKIERELTADGRRHLLLVSYTDDHVPHEEWVYNGPEIDSAPVVWARAMDGAANQRLREYFADRDCRVIIVSRDGISWQNPRAEKER